jgi:hypothetical protein
VVFANNAQTQLFLTCPSLTIHQYTKTRRRQDHRVSHRPAVVAQVVEVRRVISGSGVRWG